eukprot:372950-Amphidinium_carterae.1
MTTWQILPPHPGVPLKGDPRNFFQTGTQAREGTPLGFLQGKECRPLPRYRTSSTRTVHKSQTGGKKAAALP